MAYNKTLLSICIPTYNRAEILRKSLESYVNNDAFDDEVEIVISDNASTDNTQQVGKFYDSHFSNIHYFKNDENIKDSNFPLSLDRGSGSYLKLMKDNLLITSDGLQYMKDIIKEYINSGVSLFFTDGILFNSKKIEMFRCESFDDFITHFSYYVTSIYRFGCWKTDWDIVKERTKYSKLQLSQDDWAYQLLDKKGEALLATRPFCSSIDVGSRSGYNWYEVHVDNYYKILQPYFDNHSISKKALSLERKTYMKGLRPFVLRTFLYKDPSYQFDTEGAFPILWRNFHNEPFFYWSIVTSPFWILSTISRFLIRKMALI